MKNEEYYQKSFKTYVLLAGWLLAAGCVIRLEILAQKGIIPSCMKEYDFLRHSVLLRILKKQILFQAFSIKDGEIEQLFESGNYALYLSRNTKM